MSMSHKATSLVALPTEIILMIFDHLYARDLENFAATNRRIREIAHDLLHEHRSLKHTYSTVDFGATYPHSTVDVGVAPYRSFEYLVLRVARDWQTAQYVERLRVTGWLTHWYPPASGPPANFPIAELSTLNLRMIRAGYFTDKARRGDEDAIVALLIFILPRLRILEVDVGSRDCQCMISTLENLRMIQMQWRSVGSREAPKNLQTVRIRASASSGCLVSMIHAVLQLPSVRTAEFKGLLLLNHTEMQSHLDLKPNNLTTLTFNECRISSKLMDSVLPKVVGLQSFSFVTHHEIARDLPIAPHSIQDALRATSQHTLRTLRILGCYRAQLADRRIFQYVGSLRGFSVLEHVTVDVETLFDEQEVNIESLWTQLPQSIQTIRLRCHVEKDLGWTLQNTPIGRCLDRSFHRDLTYPNLRVLALHGMLPRSRARYRELTSDLRSNGVSVEMLF